ncbi:hypothetical protein, partial [Endozoicomonas acroporae]|uniref:hypothetical protein n=1 Tax=Endozoicomonas acroporae TaxID=1701104 RepID=UPI0019D57289
VETSGYDADAGIGWGECKLSNCQHKTTTIVNSYVNGTKEGNSSISNDQLLCQKADPRVLTADCSLRTEFLAALNVSYSDACPVNAATATTAAAVPTVTTRRRAVVANTTQVNSFARSTGYPSGNKTEEWIEVTNATTLGKIGHDPDYPLNGTYRQTADIDVSQLTWPIGSKNHPFTGEYDGQCRTISNLSDCFVDTLKGNISHLQFTGANINSWKTTGLAACVVDKTGTVSNIRAKDVRILTKGYQHYAGIGGGRL